MDTPRATVVGARRNGEDGVLREGEGTATGGVGGVVSRIGGDDEIVRVVAASEEETDERFIVGLRRPGPRRGDRTVIGTGDGTHQAELRERGQ
jgi:hypothetical protein